MLLFLLCFFILISFFVFFILSAYIYSFLKIHLEKKNAGARVLRRIFRITTFVVWISLKLKTICQWVNVSLSFHFCRSSICIHFVSGSIHIFQQFSSSVLSHHFIASFRFYYYYLLCAFFYDLIHKNFICISPIVSFFCYCC